MNARLDRALGRHRGPAPWWRRIVPFVGMALLLHLAFGVLGDRFLPYFQLDPQASAPMRLVILQPPVEPPPEVPEDPEQEDLSGQIVELPPPEEEVRPDEADYLAEHDITVPEETRTDMFEVNPEILANQWSQEQKMEQEDLIDLDVDKPSTGAQVGNDRPEPDTQGDRPALPSPWALTNKDGLQDPVPAAHMSATMSGSPQNDLLDEIPSDRVALNAKEYLYASYLNRIRRLVNFYWQQNIDNLPSSVRLLKSGYTTGVEAVLDGNGVLEMVEVVHPSGVSELDNCVVRAFRVAGPFPNPPEGLIEKDGRVYLPSMSFTVRQGQVRLRYGGVDPRAGVQFPGILKSPN